MQSKEKETFIDKLINKTNDIDALINKKTKLETYRNNHRAKVALYQFLKNSNPIKQGNIAIIPRFSTNSDDIRVMSKQEFENELMVDEVCQSTEPPIRMIKNIPEWKNLFGKGEFPFMTVYAFRLGNTEYFAYEIHR